MSSDRLFMRHEYHRPRTTMLVWLVSVIAAAFVVQLIFLSPTFRSSAAAIENLALTIRGIQGWHLWSLFTHALLHSTGSPWHILFTILGLIFVGRELEPLLGPQRFLGLFVGAIVFSGLCWTAVHWTQGGAYIGAGAAIFAFLVVLSAVNPATEMTLLFFPVSFRLRHIILTVLAVELLALLFYEIPGAAVPLGLSPSTNLGGMLAGWLFFKFIHAREGWDRAASLSWPRWLRWKRRPAATATTPSPPRTGNLRADVDRILDKINSHGFGSLSDDEKQILDAAKDLLSKR